MARGIQFLGLAAVAAAGVIAARQIPWRERPPVRSCPQKSRSDAARRIDWSAALLAAASLSDSGIEHYRGSFHDKAMYAPLAVATLALATSARDAVTRADDARLPEAVDYLALATGIIGTGFHLYNIGKRPGGFSWLNLFYAAPLGAPAALSLSGLLRRMAAMLRGGQRGICGVRTETVLAGLVSVGLVGTSAEAALLHFRGAYHNPAMLVPVTLPPIAADVLARAACNSGRPHHLTRWALWALAAVGFFGAGFHAYGVGRNMGGWRNWSQNLLNGPPLPAPPSFTALAVAGLAALDLIEVGPQ